MRIVIAGGHGKIALELERLIAARGDSATALVRNPDHFTDVWTAGAVPVHCDLETADVAAVAEYLTGAQAAVFAAGAGAGSGPERKETVDKAAAALFAAAAQRAGVRRFVQISSMGIDKADDPSVTPEFAVYLKAKGAAEEDLRARDLDWTILRPGALTDEPAKGTVALGEKVDRGSIPRADVAAVILALIDRPETVRQTLEVVSGADPI
ncbi:NAD(P)H-binding protein [Umezawaea tangerina]|uniref:Putative NADH-flavin reductase n=1 Tax=Umezawaea tangerina TaxID=84725 RepID=A0A2T0TJT2_9PSEU|nr:NAD(P)H-binding protein [Umezawaea tangerina]PRY45923.1 putative NADH-flavin reductase [Umezawaea tangerina]